MEIMAFGVKRFMRFRQLFSIVFLSSPLFDTFFATPHVEKVFSAFYLIDFLYQKTFSSLDIAFGCVIIVD
jgi:hypothetical protein